MKKIWFMSLIALLTTAMSVQAGDIANFVNLGFSPDGEYFAFGQYGVQSKLPFAELNIVDVATNKFAPSGRERFDGKHPVSLGQDGSGALYTLVARAAEQLAHHHVNSLEQGRLIYLYVNGEFPNPHVDFRDFETDNRYLIALEQTRRADSAAFHINLTVESQRGRRSNYTIGLPNYYRQGVASYRLIQAFLSPDERSVVFVVEKSLVTDDAEQIRYMVETVPL